MEKQSRLHLTVGQLLALGCVALIAVFGTASAASGKAAKVAKAPAGAVYTETNDPVANSVVVFDRNGDGTLLKRQAVLTGGKGSAQSVGCGPGCPILDSQNAVVISESGPKMVYAVNAGSNTVSSFRETAGGLVLVDTEPSGGVMPESLALHGDLLYVLNVATANGNGTTGNIFGLKIAGNGSLSPIGSSQPLTHPAPPDHSADPRAIGFDSHGKVLVVTLIAGGFMTGPPGLIDTFVVDHKGKAAPGHAYPSSDTFPFGFAMDKKGHLVVSNVHDPNGVIPGTVSSYDVTGTGVVAPIDTKPSGGVLPCWVAINGNGKYAYVVNTGAGMPGPINSFGLSPGGILNPLAPAAASQAGEFARTDVALVHNDKFLYVLVPNVGVPTASESHVDGYRVNNDGSLTLINQTLPSGLGIGVTGLAAR